ncbi:MAG: phosphomannomutase/phosphoglucomutase [Spirochaetales bacterium]|nr:phosphomannomutase/phosphoglucomutase [Spirochaetales bacterium]
MEIFKAYDIRGKYGEGIDTDFAYVLGRGIARLMKGKTYMVGYDARIHSESLSEALIRGLVDEGIAVVGIGLTSTPCLHYLQVEGGYDAGIMVTASHNPPEYHGFKVFDATGGSISLEKGLAKVRDMLPLLKNEVVTKKGSFHKQATIQGYIDFLKKAWGDSSCHLKIIVDISNGSAGDVFYHLGKNLGLNIILLHPEPDGSFPHHNPNPLEKESRVRIARAVKEEKAAAGAILDGDGDRVLFVDENGEMIQNYFMAALIAEELFESYPNRPVVYDLISSRVLPERIRECGGIPVVSKVGYTNLYDKMVETDAIFGAETSGHVYFKVSRHYYSESAAYAVLLLLKLLVRRGKALSGLIAPLKERYFQAEEINIHVKNKEASMKNVEDHYRAYHIDTLDGMSIDAGDFWFNVRPSNTEPLLRLRLEAKNGDIATEKAGEIKALMEKE